MHVNTQPSILYFGTPVALISTRNANGTDNLAPMSSIFWLGWRCIIGLAAASQTTQNLICTQECVINLPSVNEAAHVDALARTTGTNPVPAGKVQKGYKYVEEKFNLARLQKQPSTTVNASRVQQCPVQMEAVVEAMHGVAEADAAMRGRIMTFELRITSVHIEESLLMADNRNKIDPDRWKPLIMSFQQFYGLSEKVCPSTLSQISEDLYNTPDRDRAINTGQIM